MDYGIHGCRYLNILYPWLHISMVCAVQVTNPDIPRCVNLHTRSRTYHKRGVSPLFNSFSIPMFEGSNISEDVHHQPKATVQQPFYISFLTYIKYGDVSRTPESHTTLLYNGNTVQHTESTPELYTIKKEKPEIERPIILFLGSKDLTKFSDISNIATNHGYFSFYLFITPEFSTHNIENSMNGFQYMEILGGFEEWKKRYCYITNTGTMAG